MASLAQFAFNTVRAGVSAREGLRQLRDAGLKVRDATWYRAVGEARAHYAGRLSELSRPQNRRPRGAAEITRIDTKTQRGFRQYVDVWIRPKGGAEPVRVTQAIVTDTLMSRQRAIDTAVEGYRRAQARRAVTGATMTTLPDAEILGGIYTATLGLVPEDEETPW
jgi:hypothetical protein